MGNWFGMPKRGAPRIRPKDVRVKAAGQTWTASWHVEDGRLIVASAHGSRSEPVGGTRDLDARATALLAEIVGDRGGSSPGP